MILTGLGVTELSMSIPSVAAVKAQLRKLAFTDIARPSPNKRSPARTAAEVRALSSARETHHDCIHDIVTVTLNPAIDQSASIPDFTAGEVNRVDWERSDPGGKGVNVASFLADLGLRVTVTGFLGRENSAVLRTPVPATRA